MARGLTAWAGGVALACAAIGVAYLPPRGAPEERAAPGGGPPPGPDRLRASALAREWRSADRDLRLAEWRERLRGELTRHREQGTPGPLLVLDTLLGPAARAAVSAQLNRVWRDLHLGISKISVAVVVVGATPTPSAPGSPARERSTAVGFLLPDSTHRRSCVVLVPVNYWSRRALERPDTVRGPQLDTWVRNGLGPCAFYAAFGRPSREIEAWLRGRGFDIALAPVWDYPAASTRRLPWYFEDISGRHRRWFWQQIYEHPFDAVSCLGGRESSCRNAIVARSAAGGAYVSLEAWWRRRGVVGAETYLSDLLRDARLERFKRFWTADVPVDSAFRTATGDDIGAWTERWQRQLGARLPLGPAAPLGATYLGALVIALASLAAALQAERRRAG